MSLQPLAVVGPFSPDEDFIDENDTDMEIENRMGLSQSAPAGTLNEDSLLMAAPLTPTRISLVSLGNTTSLGGGASAYVDVNAIASTIPEHFAAQPLNQPHVSIERNGGMSSSSSSSSSFNPMTGHSSSGLHPRELGGMQRVSVPLSYVSEGRRLGESGGQALVTSVVRMGTAPHNIEGPSSASTGRGQHEYNSNSPRGQLEQDKPMPRNFHFECFRDMLENPFLSDISIRTSDGLLIPAHKVVLAAVSPTIRTMFSSPLSFGCEAQIGKHGGENKGVVTGANYVKAMSQRSASRHESGSGSVSEENDLENDSVICVPYSYEEGAFKLVLQYMYTGSISGFEPHMAVSLLEASSYFQLDELKALAVRALCSSTTEENVFERLDLALSYNCVGLREHSLMIIRQYNTEVIHSREWLALPLDVALLLVQETVIEGEMAILQRCYEWCLSNCTTPKIEDTFVKFLKFVDFTAMTEAEVSEVESMRCVPISILYDAFKRSVLGLALSHVQRNGGIVLQWEMKADQHDVEVVNNHVTKISADYIPRTVCAINKFSRGRHYWTVNVMDLRLPHDSFVGVMFRPTKGLGGSPPSASSLAFLTNRDEGSRTNHNHAVTAEVPSPLSPNTDSVFANSSEAITFVFEPCCMAVRAPEGCEILKEAAAQASILMERWCEVGVLLDFTDNVIRWYNHRTKALLFTLKCPGGGPLPSPLYPCVTLIHRSNGGAMLSESTTYIGQRPPHGKFAGPTSVTPIKSGATRGNPSGMSSSAILAAGGTPAVFSASSPSQRSPYQSPWSGQGLASVPPAPPSRFQSATGVYMASGTM